MWFKSIYIYWQLGKLCSYFSPRNISDSNNLFEKYGVNAAHARYPDTTVLIVDYHGTSLLLMVNDLVPETDRENVLELSKEAAKMLGIEKNTIVPCQIKLYQLNEVNV